MSKSAIIIILAALGAVAQGPTHSLLTHPRLKAARDLGRLDASHPMDRMMMVLKTSPEREAALDQLMAEQRDPKSPHYQQWLTPQQFGDRFGASTADLEAVSSWLRSRGFAVHEVPAGRQTIEFSGIAAQVDAAFRTEMRHYEVDGQRHIANGTPAQIPEQFHGLIEGLSLNSFRAKPMHVKAQLASQGITSGHFLTPYDFATIYNVTPLWNAGNDGTGQTIAIPGRAVPLQGNVDSFRTYYGMPASTTQVITTTYDAAAEDPSDYAEAELDVQWSGGVAKGAAIIMIASTGTPTTDGVDLAVSYAVNNNVASIISLSYGLCEAYLGSGNTFYRNIWKQAASQGISVFVSTGDSGSAGCETSSDLTASHGFAVNGLASTPYNVAVGGTQFNENAGSYWNPAKDSHRASAKSYIPESVWNESSYGGLWAGSGGVSTLYGAPAWQTGFGVPTVDPQDSQQHHRALPDVSLSASTQNGYLIMMYGASYYCGGTSASSPAFAGIMALVNQRTGTRNGLANPHIYALAAQSPGVFHDTASGSTAVPCVPGSPNCSGGMTTGYAATPGYDVATGWGSVDANLFVTSWASAVLPPLIESISPNPMLGSDSEQILTISGSGFQPGSGLTVVANTTGVGTSVPLQGIRIVSASTTVIQAALTVGTAGHVWWLKVVNPNQRASNPVLFSSTAPSTIVSVSPSALTGSASPQTLTINGTGFVEGPGMIVMVGYLRTWFSLTGSQISYLSPTRLTAQVTTGLTARTWSVAVVNNNAEVTNFATFQVNQGTAAPEVRSFSPNPMFGSASPQTLTIYGYGFLPGTALTVVAGYPGANFSFSGSKILSQTATQIQVQIDVGLVPRTWAIGVINPGAVSSNIATLQVNLLVPTIASFNPNPMTGSVAAQTLTINGSGFQPASSLIAGYTGFSSVISGTPIKMISSTQIQAQINVGTTARTWALAIVNGDGGVSNVMTLTVSAAVIPPVITSFSPSPMDGSSSNQTLTINGTGFQAGAGLAVVAGYAGTTLIFSGSQIGSVTSTRIQLPINVGTATRLWAIGVINPGGVSSNLATLQVNAPVGAVAVPPVVLSFNPSPMTGSSANQTLTINGTGFQGGAGLAVMAGYTGGTTLVFAGSQITSVTSTQIQLPINVGTTARLWAIAIINPGGVSSNIATLQVNPPAPAITSFNPSPMTGSSSTQTLTINGSGFMATAGLSVVAGYAGNTFTITGPQLSWISATQLTVQINVGTTPRTWALAVVNTNGGVSNIATLAVH